MTQRLKNSKRPAGATAAQVVEFLRDNPDFFVKHPESLEAVLTPDRPLGDGIADFQQAMIDRLRDEVGDLSGQQRDLVTTTRANLQSQGRVHECILALLAVKSFEELIQTVTTDIAVILDLDVVTLCIEATDPNNPSIRKKGLIVVPAGTIDAVMDADRRLALRGDIVGEALFDFNQEFRVLVLSEPRNAEIVVDGAGTGQYTPGQVALRPGRHVLAVRKAGYSMAGPALTIDLEADRATPGEAVSFTLRSNE